MTRSNRLLVLLAGAVLLAVLEAGAVPVVWMTYMVFFGPGLACGDICDSPVFADPEYAIMIAAVAFYAVIMGLGVWWVAKGKAD